MWRLKKMSQVPLQKKVLSENDRIAASLRERFRQNEVLCVNLISSPGSGKTTLLERTLEVLPPDSRVAVLTGDIQTENDAARLKRFGFPVKQITTGGTCHLDARMIERHLEDWDLAKLDTLFIENVGNLVCPSSYDLGEAAKIVILSVTEGEDKPLKYPSIFFKSELLVLSKTDLLPFVPFDPELAERNARRVHPGMEILRVSCLTRIGMAGWLNWLRQRRCKECELKQESVALG
jgi:hydrogenase nickel incorporation protein HypB